MMSGMAALMAAVSGTSLVCYLLMTRGDRRERAGGDASGIGSSDRSGGEGWNPFSWFDSDSSSSSSDSGGNSGGEGGGDGD
jgi:hypothetical protein